MESRQKIDCPVCDSREFAAVYDPWEEVDNPVDLYGAASGMRGTQHIVKCDDCEMVYENPRFPEETILKGYSQSKEGEHDSQYPVRVMSFYRTLRRLQKHLPPTGSRILDIGTAGGAFVEAANQFGYQSEGLEPSQFLVDQAQSRGLNVKCGTIDHHDFREKSFDLITLWDVIEHLTNPKEALEKIKPLLKEDGTLLVNYPDIGTLQAKMAGKRFWWILSSHLHYFTRKTIGDLLLRVGFEPVAYRRYWQTLEFGYLQKMAARLRVPMASAINSMTPKAVQRLPLSYYASQTTVIARPK